MTVGLDNLKGLFQPKGFYDSIILDPDKKRFGIARNRDFYYVFINHFEEAMDNVSESLPA